MDPMTRNEIFMAAAAGEFSGEVPQPVTRSEHYWEKIIEKIDEGGSVPAEAIDAAIEDYLNTHDADIVTEAELAETLEGKANASHTHDDRYYTEAEMDAALSGKANASHTHAQSDVTGLETALSGKANTSHTHDDRYYTEAEIDTVLSGKSNTGHSHAMTDVTGLDSALAGKANASHTHTKSQITDLANATASAAGLMSAADKTKLDGCRKMVVLSTQAAYEALDPPDADTVYLILEETT